MCMCLQYVNIFLIHLDHLTYINMPFWSFCIYVYIYYNYIHEGIFENNCSVYLNVILNFQCFSCQLRMYVFVSLNQIMFALYSLTLKNSSRQTRSLCWKVSITNRLTRKTIRKTKCWTDPYTHTHTHRPLKRFMTWLALLIIIVPIDCHVSLF